MKTSWRREASTSAIGVGWTLRIRGQDCQRLTDKVEGDWIKYVEALASQEDIPNDS